MTLWPIDSIREHSGAQWQHLKALMLYLFCMQGSWIVNNARGAIVNVDDIKEACESGQLGGAHDDLVRNVSSHNCGRCC